MVLKIFCFKSEDGICIFVYCWNPEDISNAKGVIQISHGMAETAARYERFAQVLTRSGFIVYANDHRGHGKTAGSVENLGYLADKDGFEWLVKDIHTLSLIIKKEHTGLPLFLLGHSMGSFAVQRYLMLYKNELNGAILSGTCANKGIYLSIIILIAKLEIKKNGLRSKSYNITKLTFGRFNNRFKPYRTKFDWLSRDNEEVDKYINDPYCGTIFTAEFFYDCFMILKKLGKKNSIQFMPKDLPIYIFSGDKDPVGNYGKGVTKLFKYYKKYGIKDVTMKLYPMARHETLNEINRDEVMKNVVDWILSKLE
ncbi:UNVERIFIED_CONTAM: alpha-beta hydrolase superfamily lysophospholipase [Acetivibrio alkalicellulosi]